MAVTVETKEEHWAKLERKFKFVTDRLGKPMDRRIIPVVVALNALGIKTYQSCEGHSEDIHRSYPWVMVDVPEVGAFHEKALAIAYAHADETPRRYSFEEHGELMRLADLEKKQVVQARQAIDSYLHDFYAEHEPIIDEAKIEVMEGMSFYIIQPTGLEEQAGRKKTARKRFLKIYQQEFQAFADFLKQCYYAQREPDENTIHT
jgi:hypothetical protein